MEHYYLNRKYKNRLFRFIFNDSHYSNPDDLVITTIDDAKQECKTVSKLAFVR